MAEDKELYQRKNGFLLYKNYIKTVNKMTNEQAGELFKMILHYANTGELLESDDPRVDSAFDFIGERLEFNTQSYVETCQKNAENAVKGGRPKESSDEEKESKKKGKGSKKPTGFSEKPKKPDIDTDIDTETDTVTETEIETDTEKHNKTSRHPHHSSQRAGEGKDEASMDEIIPYGENQNPTTRGVIVQMEQLANELIRKYCGRAAYENDVQNVFDKCYTVAELPDGELYAAYSPERAELLRYAFKQAGNAGSVNWKYIEGIYDNFEKRRIKTVEDAIQSEYAWQRGEMTA